MAPSIAIHLIGLVMWLGGLMLVTRVAVLIIKNGGTSDLVGKVCGRLYFGFVVPGLAMMTVTGVYQLMLGGMANYMKQGWFHGKLTFVLALYLLSILFFAELKRIKSGAPGNVGKLMMIHGLSAVALLVITFLTIVGRSIGQ